MTSKKFGIALLSLVVLALFAVAPASADVVAKNISAGDTVFIGESGLNITGLFTNANGTYSNSLAWFASGTNAQTDVPSVQYTITSTIADDFYVDPASYGSYAGAWYRYNASEPTHSVLAFYAYAPSLSVSLWNADTGKSVDGQKIISGNYVSIRIDSNLAPLFQRVNNTNPSAFYNPGTDGVDVYVKTPDGATLVDLYAASTGSYINPLADQQVSKQNFFVNGTGLTTATATWCARLADYKAGEYQIYAELNVNHMKDNLGSVTGKTVSNTATVTIDKETISITADKENVVRNNDFTVTLDGAPKQNYYVWISGTNGYSKSTNYPPRFTLNQNSVSWLTATNLSSTTYKTSTTVASDVVENFSDSSNVMYNAWSVLAETGSDGKITIGLTTDSLTKDAVYTIRAQKHTAANTLDSQLYDTVKVRVEKGAVIIIASGDGSYYLGEEVVLSGTNTDTDYVYLFITGPNLPTNGGVLTAPQTAFNETVGSNYMLRETVKSDDTWEYKWDTSSATLDAGTYTIYAVSARYNKEHLSDAKYDTVSIVIKKPFVTATTSASTVAKGDKLYIRGTAEGNPTEGVGIWILGKNYWNGGYGKTDYNAMTMVTETVNDDGSFECELGTADTKNLASGQYFVVVQHPMYNNKFDVIAARDGANNRILVKENLESASATPTNTQFIIWGDGKLQGSDAAEALINAINSPDIDDTYTKLTFLIEEPWIRINSIDDHYVGDVFKISGKTNLAVDDDLIVEVTSSSFQPTQKTQSGEFSGVSETVKVTEGETYNEWSMDVDASTFKPDEYIVNVEAIEATSTATTTFNVLKGAAPTTPTTGPTTAPTTGPTTAPTPEPTATPGFGAFVALIGLGAVAALVMRKD